MKRVLLVGGENGSFANFGLCVGLCSL